MYGFDSVDLMAHAVAIICCFVTAITAVVSYMLTMRG
jgi:hypothetical protein